MTMQSKYVEPLINAWISVDPSILVRRNAFEVTLQIGSRRFEIAYCILDLTNDGGRTALVNERLGKEIIDVVTYAVRYSNLAQSVEQIGDRYRAIISGRVGNDTVYEFIDAPHPAIALLSAYLLVAKEATA